MQPPKDLKKQLEFYKNRFDEVHIVTCDKCGTLLAIEVKSAETMQPGNPHPEGRQVIPVNYDKHPLAMALLAWRPRLDGAIGYQCGAMIANPKYPDALKQAKKVHAEQLKAFKAAYKGTKIKDRPTEPQLYVSEPEQQMCLNDTRVARSEGFLPQSNNGQAPPQLNPFEENEIRTRIALSGNKPDIETKGNKTRIERFTLERIK